MRLNDARRHACHNGTGRNIFNDDAACGDDGAFAHMDAFNHDGIGADKDIVIDDDGLRGSGFNDAGEHSASSNVAAASDSGGPPITTPISIMVPSPITAPMLIMAPIMTTAPSPIVT